MLAAVYQMLRILENAWGTGIGRGGGQWDLQ